MEFGELEEERLKIKGRDRIARRCQELYEQWNKNTRGDEGKRDFTF